MGNPFFVFGRAVFEGNGRRCNVEKTDGEYLAINKKKENIFGWCYYMRSMF